MRKLCLTPQSTKRKPTSPTGFAEIIDYNYELFVFTVLYITFGYTFLIYNYLE